MNIFNDPSTTADGCDAQPWAAIRAQQHLALRKGVYEILYRAWDLAGSFGLGNEHCSSVKRKEFLNQ